MTAATFGGWGEADAQAFGDLVSTMPRSALNAAVNFASLRAGNQYAYLIPVTAAFSSTGTRYVTSSSSGTAGNSVTVTAYSGPSQGALTRISSPAAAPFTTAGAKVDVAWGAAAAVTPNWLALVFTCTAAGATPPRLTTPSANNVAGAGFLNPAPGAYTALTRAATTLPDVMDFTTGWSTTALPAWLSAF
ncbi:hypothetical protein [Amycolatopsis sp. NPDC004378]